MSSDNFSKIPFEQNNGQEQNSDSDEYVDLTELVEEDAEHIFQFHLNLDKLILKYIGKSSQAPDIIIKENFGPNGNMYLYSCVYSHNELEMGNERENTSIENDEVLNSELFLPIIKLIIKHDNNMENQKDVIVNEYDNESKEPKFTISSFAIKLNEKVKYEDEFTDWELYWVENVYSNEYIKTKQIEKNINSTNIVEKLIEMSLKHSIQ
jgi:hypothetical protein